MERCTKLSASGLVYRHYGRGVISEYYPELVKTCEDQKSGSELEWVYNKMYNSFMEAIDAIDTGVEPIPQSGDEEMAIHQSLMRSYVTWHSTDRYQYIRKFIYC